MRLGGIKKRPRGVIVNLLIDFNEVGYNISEGAHPIRQLYRVHFVVARKMIWKQSESR